MRHYPFINALAETASGPQTASGTQTASDTQTPDWLGLAAGFHVLRMFDVWADQPALLASDTRWVAKIQTFTEQVPVPLRALLQNATRTLVRVEGSNVSAAVGPLIAYAWYLRSQNQHELAADVYETLAKAVDPPSGLREPWLAMVIYLQWGVSLMYAGQWDAAEIRYALALDLASGLAEDLVVALTIRTWFANLWMQRGNLGEAEEELTQVIAQAEAIRQTRVSGFARRVRGSIMQRRGRNAEALREFYTAHTHVVDDIESDLLLSDMAACLAELGIYKVARQVHVALASVGLTPLTRILALTNLLEIAVWERDRQTFDDTRERLRAYSPPNEIKLSILLYEAQGTELWESRDAAILAYQEVAEQAHQAQVHHIEFYALEAAERLLNTESEQAVPTAPAGTTPTGAEPDQNVDDVANAISALCELKMLAGASSDA
jgi:tetratricopeptide (TPR) repeat protein